MSQPVVFGVDTMRSKVDLATYARYYLCVSDGTWVRISKPDFRAFINATHRHETQYVVQEEHEKNVGFVAYVQPIRKFEWTTISEDASVCYPDPPDVAYTVVRRVHPAGGDSVWVARVTLPNGSDYLVGRGDTVGDARHACMIDYADRKRGVK